jgi:hypothetical protein
MAATSVPAGIPAGVQKVEKKPVSFSNLLRKFTRCTQLLLRIPDEAPMMQSELV